MCTVHSPSRSLLFCVSVQLNEDVQSPTLLHSESVTFEASTLSLSFSASLEYVGKSADGNFDDNFNLGLHSLDSLMAMI